mmetsp:Transcript_69097/g.114852  ORF Transcript_69097/g.114852 Transcript_69097/m.114852 type:complete len:369 (-) Transcript_69097:12-1118(-)
MSKKGTRESASSLSGEVPASSLESARFCSLCTRPMYSLVVPLSSWLITRWRTGTSCSTSEFRRRALSATERRVGMPTTTKSVTSSSVKRDCSNATRSRHRSSLFTAISSLAAGSNPLEPSTPLSSCSAPSTRPLSLTSLVSKLSRKSGKARSRNVWPVGAVSKITRAYDSAVTSPSAPLRTSDSTSASASSSSSPGGELSRMSANSSSPSFASTSSATPPSPRSAARKPPTASRKRVTACSVSTSIACKFSHPTTSTGEPPDTSSINASPSECAGSVLTISVRRPLSAQRVAMALDVEVLPTPPFPPTKTSRCAAPPVRSWLSGPAAVVCMTDARGTAVRRQTLLPLSAARGRPGVMYWMRRIATCIV